MARASVRSHQVGVGVRLLGATALSLLLMAGPALAGGIARTAVERAQEACPDQCVVWPQNGASAVDLSHLDDLVVNLTATGLPDTEWSFKWCHPRPSKICPEHGATRGFVFTKVAAEKCSAVNSVFQELTQTSIPTNEDQITLRYTDISSNSQGKMVVVNLNCDHSLPMHVAKPTNGQFYSNWPTDPEIFTIDFNAKIACKVPPAPVAPAPFAPLPPSPSDCRFYPQNGGNQQIDLSVLKNWARIMTQGGNKVQQFWEVNWCIPRVTTKCSSVWSQPGFIFQSGPDGNCDTYYWVFQKMVQAEGGNGDPIVLTYEDVYHPDGGKRNGTMTFNIECDEGGALDTVYTNSMPPHILDNWPSDPERLTVSARGKIACKNAFP